MNRDIINTLLHHLDPRTALELRRCSHQLNRWVSHSDLYWYYQTLGYSGRKCCLTGDSPEAQAAGATRVHVKQWSMMCINDRTGYCRPDYPAAYAWLLERADDEKSIALEDEMLAWAQAEKARRAPYISDEQAELFGKRSVCMRLYTELDRKFCGRSEHFQWAYGGYATIGGATEEYLESKREENGLYMFQYLFKCYRNTRKKVQNIKSVAKAQAKAQDLRDTLLLLESQITEIRAELAILDDFSVMQEQVKTSVFNRRSEKTYHNRKEVKKTF